MARKSKLTTSEKIVEKQQQITNKESELQILNSELDELLKIKMQEDKDELYELILSKNYTVEKAKELIASAK